MYSTPLVSRREPAFQIVSCVPWTRPHRFSDIRCSWFILHLLCVSPVISLFCEDFWFLLEMRGLRNPSLGARNKLVSRPSSELGERIPWVCTHTRPCPELSSSYWYLSPTHFRGGSSALPVFGSPSSMGSTLAPTRLTHSLSTVVHLKVVPESFQP